MSVQAIAVATNLDFYSTEFSYYQETEKGITKKNIKK